MTASISRSLRALLVYGFVAFAGLLAAYENAGAQDISSLVSVTKSERSLTDLRTKLVTTTANITIKNISSSVIGIPLQAVFDISSASVQVQGAVAPGTGNPYGKYYVDISNNVAAGVLQPAGTVTFSVKLVCPSTVRYTYKVVTYGAIIKATPTISWADPATIEYGTLLSTTQLNATASTPGSFVYTPAIGAQLSVGTQSLKADFTPTDTTNYNTTSAMVNIFVTKATPTITWADPAAIAFGTALTAIQLNATSPVSGNFTYTPGAGTQLSAGNHALNTDFLPTDTTNYNTISATVNITVNAPTALNKVPVANAGPDQTVTLAGGQRSIDVHLDGSNSSDPDGTVSAYLWTGIPGPVPNSAVRPTVTLYPGTYRYSLVVTDDKGAKSLPSNVTITVNQQLGPPQLTVDPLNYSVNQGETVTFAVSATHPDGNVVTLSAMPFIKNATFVATPGASAAGTFTFSPDGTQSGIRMVTFTARDRFGLTDSKTVQITVNKVNHAPVITIPSAVSVDVGKQVSIKAVAADPDGDILTLSASGLPQNALFIPATGTITLAPDTTQVGQFNVTVNASDGKLSASATSTITVNSFQSGGTSGSSQLILNVDPVASLSLQPTQRITGSVNAPNQPVIPLIQSALIVGMNPATGYQGNKDITVTLTGQATGSFPTHFVQGSSMANFGTGITVNSFTVTSPTSATANISIVPGADLGARLVNVTTGNEAAVSLIAFNVLPGVASISGRVLDSDSGLPLSGARVVVTGTGFSTTTVFNGTFLLTGVPAGLNSFTVNAANHEVVSLTVSAQVGSTVNAGDIKTLSTVFNPASSPSATLMSVLGRGGSDFFFPGMSKDDVKKMIIDAIIMTGGKSAGVLDGFGNQLNPNITGNGVISLRESGVDVTADRILRGETMTVGDFLNGFPLFFGWKTEPTLLRALSALQDVVDQAWANPNDPLSTLTITVFNRGRSTLYSAPQLAPETPLNALQAYIMASTLFAWANNEIYYMNGSDVPPPVVLIGSREKALANMYAYYGDLVATDAPGPILVADANTAPVAYAAASPYLVNLVPENKTKDVTVTLDGSISRSMTGTTITKYQWRPTSSADPTPPDGPDPTTTVKITGGSRHTYQLYVTDSNGLQSTSNVTFTITGDCNFTSRNDLGVYPWCSTFTKFLGDQALSKIDVVKAYVGDITKTAQALQTMKPLTNGTIAFQTAAANSVTNFFAGKNADLVKSLNSMASTGQLKALYQEAQASAKLMNQLSGFTSMSADFIKGQLDSFVGALADQLFDYLINMLSDQIIEKSRPAPPMMRSVELIPAGTGSGIASQQVKLTFSPSGDEISDFNKSLGSGINGIRKYAYMIYRQVSDGKGLNRIDIIPASNLSGNNPGQGTLGEYTWVDRNPYPGTSVYNVATRVVRTTQVPPTVDYTTQKMAMDYMLGMIPGGGTMGMALWKSFDLTDKILRGLMLQDSDLSEPERIFIGDPTRNLHPELDLAVDKHGGNVYLSIPSTSGIFKIVPGGIELFADAGFKNPPGQAGLAADSRGNLYSDNKASDDSFGGRIFSFQAGTGARTLAGSSTYYSLMLQYARSTDVATLAYGVDRQGEAIYIADNMDKSIKRMSLYTANPPDHNVGQPYAQSNSFAFLSTTKMASDLFGTLFLTQGSDLMQVLSLPGGGAAVSSVFPSGQSPFNWLTGVDFDLMGNIYLADMGEGTITMIPQPYGNFLLQDSSYRKRFVVLSGLTSPQDLKLTADGRGFVTVDAEGIQKRNFGVSGRLWDKSINAPLAGAIILADGALAQSRSDADGYFILPDISFPSGPQDVKLTVVAPDGRTQLIPNIYLNTYGHTALLQDLVFDPPPMPRLTPIPPADANVTIDPDPLPIDTPQFQLDRSSLGQTRTGHFIVPDRRIYPTSSLNPPPLPPPSSISETLGFAPSPADQPTPPAPSSPSIVQPTVAIVSPGDQMITTAGSVNITGMVESTQNITSAVLTVNGVDQVVQLSKGVFTATVALNDGLNIISARAGSVSSDMVNNISYLEGRSTPVKVQKGGGLTPSLDFSGVVFRADGTSYKPYAAMMVTLYAMIDPGTGTYRIIDSVSVGGDGRYQFHLENGVKASAGVQSLFQIMGTGAAVPMKITVSDPRS